MLTTTSSNPFSARELIARVHAMLRRPRSVPAAAAADETPAVTFGDVSVDLEGRQVSLSGVPVELTRTEFDLSPAVSCWTRCGATAGMAMNMSSMCTSRTCAPNWATMRPPPGYIRTIRGVGYGLGSR